MIENLKIFSVISYVKTQLFAEKQKITESRKAAADKTGPAGGLLFKADQVVLQLIARQRAAARESHRRPVERAPADGRQPVVLRVKSRLVGRVQPGKNGSPVAAVVKILRAEI